MQGPAFKGKKLVPAPSGSRFIGREQILPFQSMADLTRNLDTREVFYYQNL